MTSTKLNNLIKGDIISHASKILKILQTRLQQYVNSELPDVQAGFRKGRGIKLPTSVGLLKKAGEFQKNIYFCFTDYAKAFDCVDHKKLWKILQGIGIPNQLTYLLMKFKRQHLEPEMEQTGSKFGKEYVKAVYCHPAYLTYMQGTSCEMLCD